MQIFIIGSPFYTAIKLKELGLLVNQKSTCCTLLDTISLLIHTRKKPPLYNHPLVKLYVNHQEWLYYYVEVIECFLLGEEQHRDLAIRTSNEADKIRPDFQTKEYFERITEELYGKRD